MNDNPCYKKGQGCPYRTVNCHSTCEKYLEWSKSREDKRKEKYRDVDYVAYKVAVINRRIKERNLKKK